LLNKTFKIQGEVVQVNSLGLKTISIAKQILKIRA
jgi:hypothetical protein